MKLNRYKYILGVFALALLSSCDFEDVNTNFLEATDEDLTKDGLAVGAPITSMQRCVFSVGTAADDINVINQYQLAYHLSADCWSGYFSQNNTWRNGNCNVNYFLLEDWVSASFTESYTNILPLWKQVKMESEKLDLPDAFALAQILKISAWHKATDMFGPIPYKQAGENMLVVPYDSQEEVYKSFFTDLTAAIDVLTDRAAQGTLLPKYDAVYGGDITKWVKYANSLLLRLAMRVRYVAPDLAQKYAEQAVNHPIGVMTAKEDAAQLSTGAGLQFINNIWKFSEDYQEARMGSSMFAYLAGYVDPRIKAYFKETNSYWNGVEVGKFGQYLAIPAGHDKKQEQSGDFFDSSAPNIEKTTPSYWMKASEVYFLRAEGALQGWNMKGTDSELYKQGITMSFEENGISIDQVDGYMNSGKKPVAYEWNSYPRVNHPAPSQATVAYEGDNEQKLEKIIIQKWISMYPNGQEAWTEWRRTGYPKLHPVLVNNGSAQGITKEEGIRRMIYPVNKNASQADKENLNKAIEMLGTGGDKATTKLWWDKKN